MPCDLSVILLFTVLTIYCSWGGWIFYHLHLEALHFVTLWLQSKNNWFFMALHFWDRSLASILLSDLLSDRAKSCVRGGMSTNFIWLTEDGRIAGKKLTTKCNRNLRMQVLPNSDFATACPSPHRSYLYDFTNPFQYVHFTANSIC